MSSTEQPFKIAVPDEDIADLQQKLKLTRFPDELEEAGHDYGAPLKDIQRLVNHWKDAYDWRKHEAQLNEELPQFTRDLEVDGFGTLNVHYIHKKSEVTESVPLLFVHGWPGSFLEVRKILPLLVEGSDNHPSFHVVAISLPGYGFSEAPKKKGFGILQYGEVSHKLMLALGYNEYVTQGGDWGGVITYYMARNYGGQYIKAWHSNFPAAPPLSGTFQRIRNSLTRLTPAEKSALERSVWFQKKSSGYFMEQSTQPQTIGYSLADSPVGLLAWIYEKLVIWTDDYPWTEDEVLTWISIYWFSRPGPAASVRIYYEFEQAKEAMGKERPYIKIPTGYSRFPKELVFSRNSWLKAIANVVFIGESDKGGHFAAYECPEVLVGHLRSMFGRGGKAFGVVSANTGFKLLL